MSNTTEIESLSMLKLGS